MKEEKDTEQENTQGRKKRDRFYYLNSGADILCREIYKLCKKSSAQKDNKDPKTVKELCAALKEAIALSISLDKNGQEETDILRIVFDDGILDLSE